MDNDNRWYLIIGILLCLSLAYIIRVIRNRSEEEKNGDYRIAISYYACLLFAILLLLGLMFSFM